MPPARLPPAVFLMGPTAAGKTGLAVELCDRFPLDIISVDSALVYRGMDIGTAKPDALTLRRAPHRLIDIRQPCESYSAAEFRSDALAEMQAITAAGRVPLLVGGTMLYFRALEQGLAALPGADETVRAQLERQAAVVGWPAMHEKLRLQDPLAAARIHPNDPQRIQRALEVIQVSGCSMSQLQAGSGTGKLPYRLHKIVVTVEPRSRLHRRIEARFEQMLEAGLLEEVTRLHARPDLHAGLPAMRAVGYRQLWDHLEGRCSLSRACEKAMAASRQLAKRQLTWLRRENVPLWYDLPAVGVRGQLIDALQVFLEG